jgi:hypothetical protein
MFHLLDLLSEHMAVFITVFLGRINFAPLVHALKLLEFYSFVSNIFPPSKSRLRQWLVIMQ